MGWTQSQTIAFDKESEYNKNLRFCFYRIINIVTKARLRGFSSLPRRSVLLKGVSQLRAILLKTPLSPVSLVTLFLCFAQKCQSRCFRKELTVTVSCSSTTTWVSRSAERSAGHGGFDAPGWRDRRWQVAVGAGVEKYATGRGASPWRHPGPEYGGLAGASI